MEISDRIGEIVATNFKTASVFRKYKIDFCCGGGKSLEAVCDENSIDSKQLLKELEDISVHPEQETDAFDKCPLDKLADYIEVKHHSYVKKTIVELIQYLNKLVEVHGEQNPELHQIKRDFQLLSQELSAHMQKEELILFPYIKRMIHNKTNGIKHVQHGFGDIRNPIQMMETEHEEAGKYMASIRKSSSDFSLPENACNTYAVAYKVLEEFEKDLHIHIHLENNILFPKADKMEKDILKSNET